MKNLIRMIALVLSLCCLAFSARAQAGETEDYLGVWVADGVAAEIWREDDSTHARVVFQDDGGDTTVWEYGACWYDPSEGALECADVSRTRERFDPTLNALVELDWSLSDLCFSGFERTDGGLYFTDEALDVPIDLVRLEEAETGPRADALAFVGRWSGDAAELRVADHGSCCLFTVTVPVDTATRHRWTYTCLFDPDSGRMTSVSASALKVITLEADGTIVEIEEDNDVCSATFALEAGQTLVGIGATGRAGEITRFERLPE